MQTKRNPDKAHLIMAFEKKRKALAGLEQAIPKLIAREIRDKREYIERMNVRQILQESTGADGKKLINANTGSDKYSPSYEAYKSSLGLFRGYIDLHLTGKLLGSIRATATGGVFLLKAKRFDKGKDVAEKLRVQFGQYEGLTDENLDKVKRDILTPAIHKAIKQAAEA